MKTMDVITTLAQQNPEAINNPRSQSLLDILRSGDEQRGIEAATNILNSMELSREVGVRQAEQGLRGMLPNRGGMSRFHR